VEIQRETQRVQAGEIVSAELDMVDVQAGQPVCESAEGKQCCVLVVDDDAELRDLLVRYLQSNGFRAFAVGNGTAMEKHLLGRPADLIVLDLMLPGKDGLAIARELRGSSDVPIIMLSAHGSDIDRIVGLEVGADDYLAKPFNPRELLARIRAVLRRKMGSKPRDVPPAAAGLHQFGPFRLDMRAHLLARDDEEVPLTAAEFKLLSLFAEHPKQLLTRDVLMNMLKGYECAAFDRSIDVAVTRLRRKIEDNPGAPQFIRTVRGEGYLFTPNGKLT
jgi:DNA-binding response OmpR family regulator